MTEPRHQTQSSASVPFSAYLLGFFGISIFGSSLPMTAVALSDFSPEFVTMARASLAAFFAALTLLILKRPLPFSDKKVLPLILVSGLMLVFGFPGFTALALKTIPSNEGGVVLGVMPLMTAIFAALITGERPSLAFWVLAILGAALVLAFTLGPSTAPLGIGHLWLLAAAAAATLGYVISGKLTRTMKGWEVIAWALIVMSPLSLIGLIWTWQPIYSDAALTSWLAVVGVAAGPMFFGFVLWNEGLRRGGIARIGQVQLLQPFVTIILAALLVGEVVSWRTILFAAAIVIVVSLGRKTQVRQAN